MDCFRELFVVFGVSVGVVLNFWLLLLGILLNYFVGLWVYVLVI